MKYIIKDIIIEKPANYSLSVNITHYAESSISTTYMYVINVVGQVNHLLLMKRHSVQRECNASNQRCSSSQTLARLMIPSQLIFL